jgi:dTDP-4-amino-4,6-dideoxygalactose transaminase
MALSRRNVLEREPSRVVALRPYSPSREGVDRTLLLPVLRPQLPAVDQILPYLRQIDQRQWYSNYGPLVCELERRLSAHYGVKGGGAVTVSNGTLGLTAALLGLDAPRGSLCLMPSWTFTATPQAAFAAGLTPYFLDVDPKTWMLDVYSAQETVARLGGRVGAVIVVSPFGAPVDIEAWEEFQARTGVPVVIDAAAGFDTAPASTIPVMVSLHATKIVGAGEGGFVMTRDRQLRDRIQACANFGFQGSRMSQGPALNAKMSEYHAAVALAGVDSWPRTRARHAAVMGWYQDGISQLPEVGLAPGYSDGWVTGTTSVVLSDGALSHVRRSLTEQNIETRQWWEQGCHAQPAFADCPKEPLPVTESLGRRVLGLPHFPNMNRDEVVEVVRALDKALQRRTRSLRRIS